MKTKAERILETMKGDKAMTRHVLSILEEAQDEEEMILDVLNELAVLAESKVEFV